LALGSMPVAASCSRSPGLKAIQRLSLRTAALGVMLGLYKIASSLLL
jgi:hypothetical protein